MATNSLAPGILPWHLTLCHYFCQQCKFQSPLHSLLPQKWYFKHLALFSSTSNFVWTLKNHFWKYLRMWHSLWMYYLFFPSLSSSLMVYGFFISVFSQWIRQYFMVALSWCREGAEYFPCFQKYENSEKLTQHNSSKPQLCK